MKDLFGRLIPMLLGAIVFWGVMLAIARTHARQWRRVAAHFGRRARGAKVSATRLETIVIMSRDADDGTILGPLQFRQYPALLTVHEDGLSIRAVPLLGVMCAPLLIRYDDMALKPTSWMLWRDPYALRMRGLDGTEIVLGDDTVRWLRDHVDAPTGP